MQSRRDQVQAHMFVMGRLTSGVLRLEPDGLDQPVSRTSKGVMGGLAAAILIAVVIALFGFIWPGGKTTWQKVGTLVVVKDSGARFLNLNGVLHPILNLSSAKLIAGDQLTIQNVGIKSLQRAPRGGPVGLVGAPDALPSAGSMTTGDWSACATRVRDDAGTNVPGLSLLIDLYPPGRGLGIGDAIPVSGPDGNKYLLWNGQRLKLDPSANTLTAAGYADAELPLVSAAFLDAVPAGPDLAVPPIAGEGGPGPIMEAQDTRLGELFADDIGNRYVLTAQGLVPLTPTLFALISGDPRTETLAYGGQGIIAVRLGPDEIAHHLAPQSAADAFTHDGALPIRLPSIVPVGLQRGICVSLHRAAGGRLSTSMSVVDTSALADHARAPDQEPGVVASCLAADQIAVNPGKGVLINASLAGGGPGVAIYLVTENGVKYPIPSSAALQALGYDGVSPTVLPTTWLDLLPTGPSLDPDALAAQTVVQPQAQQRCDGKPITTGRFTSKPGQVFQG